MFTIIIAGVVILGIVAYFLLRKKKFTSLGYKLLSIRIPLAEEKEKQDLGKDLALAEQLYASLLSLGGPFAMEASVHNVGENIHFYISVPDSKAEFVARQIQGLYLHSRVDGVNDYTVFSSGGTALGASLTLRDEYILPLRTYADAPADTFSQVISNLSKLGEVGEGASVQIVVRPAPDGAKKKILKAIESLKHGEKISHILKSSFIMDTAKDLIKGDKKDDKPPTIDDDAVKALNTKLSKPLFSVNLRVLASGEDKERAESILMSVAGAYAATTAPLRNELVINKPRNLKKLLYRYAFREYDMDTSNVLNSEELSSLFHLPTGASAMPRLAVLRAKEAPPPENMQKQGVVVAFTTFRGDSEPVRLTDADRLRHLYVIGQTGTGKSVTMMNMMVQDMEAGRGFTLIDPHGDLVDNVLERVPANRAGDVIVFDPGDLARPLGINILEYDFNHPEQKNFIVNEKGLLLRMIE